MSLKALIALGFGLTMGTTFATAGGISFTCDPNFGTFAPAGTCATLNSTIAGIYSSTFTNADASVYIQFGTTGLGSSTQGFTNQISYDSYRSALIAENGPGSVRASAIASLPAVEPGLYNGAPIDISNALGAALGISGLIGTTASGSSCTLGGAGCYNGIITVTTDPSTPLFFRNGAQSSDSYDYYSVVEHELNEVLGTSSCISTTGPALANDCTGAAPSEVDLFRYNGNGNRVLLDGTPGAYFSYDGGATNGTGGAIYNTLANGDDYADFISGCPTSTRIQDGEACPGQGGLDITNDGGAEINILDAIGYNLRETSAVPEPSALCLLGAGLAVLRYSRRKRV